MAYRTSVIRLLGILSNVQAISFRVHPSYFVAQFVPKVRGFLYETFVTRSLQVSTARSCQHLAQPSSWKISPCRLSATAYAIYSQLPVILVTVPPPSYFSSLVRIFYTDGVQDHEIHIEQLLGLKIRISDAEIRLAVFVTGNERVTERQRIRLWLKPDWCSLSIYTIACKRG